MASGVISNGWLSPIFPFAVKTLACAALSVAALSWSGQACFANLSGSDNFNDNSKNPFQWWTDAGTAYGSLSEANGRLEYIVPGPNEGMTLRPWILNWGSYTENWQLQIDTTVTTVAGVGKQMGFGLEIRDADSSAGLTGKRIGIFHESSQTDWDFFTYSLNAFQSHGSNTLSAGSVAALRITFDAGTKVLSSYFDADGPANGYAWTLAGSFGVAGSGGLTGNDNWGFTDSSRFQIMVGGSASNRQVNSGVVYGDNFQAVPEPSSASLLLGAGWFLTIRRRRGRV